MASQRRRSRSPRQEKHGWLALDRYQQIHQSALQHHYFVLEDRTEFTAYKEGDATVLIRLEGTITCRCNIAIEVEKYLDPSVNARNKIEVRGLEYRYHAHVLRQGNLLRYDNHHGPEQFDRHVYDFATQRHHVTVIDRASLPTLIEVVSEVEKLAACQGLRD